VRFDPGFAVMKNPDRDYMNLDSVDPDCNSERRACHKDHVYFNYSDGSLNYGWVVTAGGSNWTFIRDEDTHQIWEEKQADLGLVKGCLKAGLCVNAKVTSATEGRGQIIAAFIAKQKVLVRFDNNSKVLLIDPSDVKLVQ